jgi:glycine dehydrogenase subunit 2
MKEIKINDLWSLSSPGRVAVTLPGNDVPETQQPQALLREDEETLDLPEVSELDVVRHYTKLSQQNFSIDTHFYPLGSCTMKYNPKINDVIASAAEFRNAHPYQINTGIENGILTFLYQLQQYLAEIAGFKEVSLQPAAGAQGELSGVMMIKSFHMENGDHDRINMLIPDSAHGTNPASVAMCGFKAVEIPSDSRGNVDISALKKVSDEKTAGIMITNPNTLGLFEEQILETIQIVHDCGGLVYGDGANLNAIMGKVKPGDLGIDVMHFNLHKTFSTPHGGGGPGAGPVGAGDILKDYLPGPIVMENDGQYVFKMPKKSIGRVKSFYGNFGVLLRAWVYITMNGSEGLNSIAENAVLNANYLKELLSDIVVPKYNRKCMHEFVIRGDIVEGISTMDIAKSLIDKGFHPPTIYFPLIVKEAMMIEPTETESRETLESFSQAFHEIVDLANKDPSLLHNAPLSTPVSRLDEVKAVKNPILTHKRNSQFNP